MCHFFVVAVIIGDGVEFFSGVVIGDMTMVEVVDKFLLGGRVPIG